MLLSIIVFWTGQSGMSLQTTVQQKQIEVQSMVQERQEKINRGTQSQQIGTNLLKDIATAALDQKGNIKNQKLKDLLKDNGIDIKVNQPTSSPTP